jgi:hypothetical protein
MKKNEKFRRTAELTMKKIREISRHIRNVSDNCLILGEKMIERGEIDLGRNLIANGYAHDLSKFTGIEFEFMAPGVKYEEENAKMKLKLAIHHHRQISPHHAEHWNGIENMPDVFLAEMLCDLKARSEEFGTSLMDYIDNEGLKQWQITKEAPIYKKMIGYVNLLYTKPFENIAQS